jgi:hypothetical protein
MRFKRAPRVEGYQETSRKRAAVLVSQRRQREKLPLFADLIAETQPSVEDVIAHRHAVWPVAEQKRRDELAGKWREARAAVFAMPDEARKPFLAWWNAHRWFPGDPGYLSSAVRGFHKGDYVLHEGKIVSRDNLEWEQKSRAKIAAMTDDELAGMIQTHISPLFVEWGRAERRRRAEAAAVEAPAPRPRRAGVRR